MTEINFSSTVKSEDSAKVSESFFGTVVKSGKKEDGVYGISSTNNALFLEGITNTTLALDTLKIGSIRYPGGTESRLFDISGEEDLAGLHRAIDYCAANNLALNFTLHDTRYFKNIETQDVFLTRVERAELSNFITEDLIGYANEKHVQIESIHIGNEFQSRTAEYGQPAWIGYAKVSAVLINEIDQILNRIDEKPYGEPDLIIQPNNWESLPNHDAFVNILVSEIGKDGKSAASKLDGIDVHGAGTGNATVTNTLELTWDDYFGVGGALPYQDNIARMINYWRNDDKFEDLSYRNDAWAYASSPNLADAALGMLQLHTASLLGITSVTSYVGYNIDQSSLVRRSLDQSSDEVNITAGGTLFAMMSDALKGTEATVLQNAPPLENEAVMPVITRAFEGDQKTVLYLVNRINQNTDVDLVANDMLASDETFLGGVQDVSVNILGSNNPIRGNSAPSNTILTLSPDQVSAGRDDFVLQGHEIAQITVTAAGNFGTGSHDAMTAQQVGGVMHGLGGHDVLTGSTFADMLAGGDGNDTLFGNDGDDVLYGGQGTDRLFGGDGIDIASYAYASGAVRLDLSQPSRNFGDAVGDTLDEIEQIEGSRFNDTLKGNSADNVIFGGAGNDEMHLSGGADTFFGGIGSGDTVHLGRNAGQISLFTGQGSGGIALSGVENLIGSLRNDRLTGNAAENTLAGRAGNDVLFGFGGDDDLRGDLGNDKLFGGRGDDRLVGGAGADTLTGGLGKDRFMYTNAHDGGDLITDFNRDSETGDLIYVRGTQFANLAEGWLNAEYFVSRENDTLARNANDRFIYRESDSTLWFDMDGTGDIPAQILARLDNSEAEDDEETAFAASHIWVF